MTDHLIPKTPGQNIIMNYSYTYDDADNIVMKATEHGDYNYTYDDLYRLTGATNPNKPAEGFTYDPVGNRLTSAEVAGEWGYNANNELRNYPTTIIDYDADGNTVKKTEGSNVTDYSWDAENRLMKVEKDGAATGVYYYDPFGRRLSKTVDGTTTYFFYSDEGLAGEFNSQGQAIKTYGFAPNSTWTTDPVFMKIGNQYYFYHNDHLGTPQKMTALNGAVVWSAKYEAFGKATVDAGSTVENNLRFPGQYYDNETGECYNWKRYYNPIIGRYISEDLIKLYYRPNLYAYVNDAPLTFIDEKGLSYNAKASCEVISAGKFYFVDIINVFCSLETDCSKGNRQTGFYWGGAFGIGVSPFQITGTFSTSIFSSVSDLDDFTGSLELAGFSIATPIWGWSLGYLCLNGHCSIGESSQTGIDFSMYATIFGRGAVYNKKTTTCCE